MSFSAAASVSELPKEACERYGERSARLAGFMAAAYGREPRDDSQLAFRWSSGGLDGWTMEVVAHEMACMQTIHEASPYHATCETVMREMAGALHAAGLPWTEAWTRVRRYGAPLVKLAAMMTCESQLPEMVVDMDAAMDAEMDGAADEADDGAGRVTHRQHQPVAEAVDEAAVAVDGGQAGGGEDGIVQSTFA